MKSRALLLLILALTSAEPLLAEDESIPIDTNSHPVEQELLGSHSDSIDLPKSLPQTENNKQPLPQTTEATLKESVIFCLGNSPFISSAKEKVVQTEKLIAKEKAGFFPKIDLNASASNVSKDEVAGGDVVSDTFEEGKVSLSLRQNLYGGGETTNKVSGAQKKLEIEKEKYRRALEEEILKAIKAYQDVVYKKDSLDVHRRSIEKLNKILEIVGIKKDAGAATSGDLNFIKSNVENARTHLTRTGSQLNDALAYYQYIVGRPANAMMPFERVFSDSIGELDESLKLASRNNSQLTNLRLMIEEQKLQLRAQYSKFIPKLDAQLSMENGDSWAGGDGINRNLTAMLTMRWNLFNGGADTAVSKKNIHRIYELLDMLKHTERNISFNVKKIHQSLSSFQQTIPIVKIEVAASRKVVESYWEAFKLGKQDLHALMTAERALNKAELELLRFQKGREADFFKLLFETGQLLGHFGFDINKKEHYELRPDEYFFSIPVLKPVVGVEKELKPVEKTEELEKEVVDFRGSELKLQLTTSEYDAKDLGLISPRKLQFAKTKPGSSKYIRTRP